MRGCNKQTFYFRRAWQVLAQTSLSDPVVLYTLFPHIYWRQESCLLRICITSYQCSYQWQNSIANKNNDEPSNDSMALRGWALSVSSSKPLLYLCSSNMKTRHSSTPICSSSSMQIDKKVSSNIQISAQTWDHENVQVKLNLAECKSMHFWSLWPQETSMDLVTIDRTATCRHEQTSFGLDFVVMHKNKKNAPVTLNGLKTCSNSWPWCHIRLTWWCTMHCHWVQKIHRISKHWENCQGHNHYEGLWLMGCSGSIRIIYYNIV